MSILQKHLDNLPATLLEIKAKKIMALQESVSKGKVTCDECGWEWNLSDGGDEPYLCKCGHDNTPGSLQENPEQGEVDLSALGNIASGIEDELEKIPTNEVVLTTLALVAGIPGILNVIAKAAKTMMQKSAINLSKKQSVLDHIIKISEKIDGYLDGPFRTILKPFVQDEAKRKKIAGVLKSITLIALGSAGGVNIADAEKIKNVVTGLAPDVAQELLQTKIPNMAEFLKGYLKSL